MSNNNYILTSSGSFLSEDELYHHGIKGMKWGVRKFQQKYDELEQKKAAYKKAKKAYNKSFNKAYNRAAAAYSPIKKHRQNNDKRWNDVTNKATKLDTAKKDYKNAKKEFRKHTTVGQKIGVGIRKVNTVMNKIGTAYLADQIFYSGVGTKAVENTLRVGGMAAITANAARRGDTDIRWTNKG